MRPNGEAAKGDPLCKNERDHVPDVHTITTRSSTGIQEKRLPLLVPIQNSVKLPMQKSKTGGGGGDKHQHHGLS